MNSNLFPILLVTIISIIENLWEKKQIRIINVNSNVIVLNFVFVKLTGISQLDKQRAYHWNKIKETFFEFSILQGTF